MPKKKDYSVLTSSWSAQTGLKKTHYTDYLGVPRVGYFPNGVRPIPPSLVAQTPPPRRD